MSKKRIANYVFLPGVSSDSNDFPNAYSLLTENKTFITKEASAFIGQQIASDTAQSIYPNAVALLTNNKQFILDEVSAWTAGRVAAATVGDTFHAYIYGATEIAKCKRDMGYLIDAIIYDIRYGGNEQVIYVSSQYYQSGVIQLINVPVELQIQNRLWFIITNYILPKVTYTSQQSPITSTQDLSGLAGEAGALNQATTLSTIPSNVMSGGLSTLPATIYSTYNFARYTYDIAKCERDVGYVLTAYLNDLRYSGNAKIRLIASKYWDGESPQIDGDRKAELVTHQFIRDLINNYVLPQAAYSPLQELYPIHRNPDITAEAGADNKIVELVAILLAVIQNGLGSMPALANGVTTIKLQGQYTLDKILLITNAANNQFIYSFSDPSLGAVATFDEPHNSNGRDQDDDYPAYLQTADYITTLTLKADTTTCSATDDIQIFVEAEEQKTRPYDFGTDAIERMRVAQPQSMLDADFEYGLQPTKWQAIGIARGYPSVYEIPGTDTAVVSVVTDASSGTGGIGESLITVTTQGAHGFIVGTPITIRSLANTISGFSRAEGTFIIISVPTTTTFTYYATAKVGTSNGQVLATTYTQLRKGSFYTGAAIGSPSFNVYSNGTMSTFTSKFITSAGSDQIAVTSVLPTLGVPITGTGIVGGTQVTGTVGPGGLAATASVASPADIGDTTISVNSAGGILEGMALDNGTGTAIFVSGISGTTISLTQPLTATKAGSTATYLNQGGTNVTPPGSGATFSLDRTNGAYTNLQVSTGGTEYTSGTRLAILGSDLGGVAPANNVVIKLATTDYDQFDNVPFSTAFLTFTAGSGDTTNIVTYPTEYGWRDGLYGAGTFSPISCVSGVWYDTGTTETYVELLSGTYGSIVITDTDINGSETITITDSVGTYTSASTQTNASGVRFVFAGDPFDLEAGGTTGSFVLTDLSYLDITAQAATFNVTIDQSNDYSVVINNPGTDFTPTTSITILGSDLGGTDVTNDLTFSVTSVTKTYSGILQSSVSPAGGTDATFDVTRTGATYSVTLVTAGTGYTIGDTITILGSELGGTDVTNDLTFVVAQDIGSSIDTIESIAGTAAGTGALYAIGAAAGVGNIVYGVVTGATIVSGTSIDGERSYTELAQSTTTGAGIDATFDVVTSGGVYDAILSNAGSGYVFNEQIVILGSELDGVDGVNDLIIDVTSASAFGGGILTFNISGLPATTDETFVSLSGSKVTPGSGATFDITRTGGSYTSIVVNLTGDNYEVNDKIKILGSNFDGSDVTNDIIITVTGAASGNINSATGTGTAVTGASVEFWSAVALSDLTSASIPDGSTITTAAIATIQISFATNHGLVPGASLLIDITSNGTNHALAKGPFYVESVPSPTTLLYTARTSGVLDTGTTLTGIVYSRPDSYFIHRPFDGGVQLGTGGPQHGAQAIRMSKKYIRYQSGKGIMYTTGALFAPSYNLQSITADGTTVGSYITVSTDDVDHGCQVGGKIKIVGVDTAGYNGTYTIVDVLTERMFKIQAQTTLANLYGAITTSAQMSILEWHGASVRAGTFDDQNGMFWQYNGKELAVGKRSSTLQLSGVSSIVKDTNLVTGTNTRFRDQVKAGDRIVIKGMTHVVSNVQSQTQMTVTPDYRGASNAVQAKVCLVQDLIVKQSEFNLDRLDGTGPSGYNLDITRMQMIGMQWSWYGAGFIDFMLRGSDGNYVFAHRIRNSNVNTEAYMRTGNMPVRYEVINEGAIGKIKTSVSATATTIPLVDASSFPNEAGIVYIDNELIAFSGKSGNSLIGCSRAAPMVNFVGGAQRTFRAGSATVHEVNTGVILISNTISPIISHWGSAMLTDGRFDEDRGYLFNYASTGIQASTTKQTAFLIRLAPSVSNAIIGDLGDRELINRAQLLLKSIAVTSDDGTGGLVIEGVLNPQNYPIDPTAITWSGLAGSSAGGQPSFAQVAPGGSVSWSGGASVTTSTATTTAALTGNATVPNSSLFQSASGSSVLYVTKTSWDTLGASVGFSVAASETKYPSGTTVSTITASPNPTATTLGLITGTATIPNVNGFATFAGQNYINVSQASWQALNAGVGSLYYGSTDFPAGTYVTQVNGPGFFSGQSYYQVVMSQNLLVNKAQGTTVAFYVTGQATSGATTLNFTQASWASLPIGTAVITNTTNDTGKFALGTQISAISALKTFAGVNYYTVTFNTSLLVSLAASVAVTFNYTPYYRLTLSKAATSTISANATVAFTPAVIATNTSFLYFTQASWETLVATYGATTGTEIVETAKFPSGTKVQSISALSSFAGTAYYRVNFTQSSITSVAAASTITFQFGLPPYALPGETVFSFIAAPGTAQTLELGELKELTNTTLGGRGTYPNGPDVLAINVYRASGVGAIPTNIVVRWGEAQA